jgi:hypothetical protein
MKYFIVVFLMVFVFILFPSLSDAAHAHVGFGWWTDASDKLMISLGI